MSAVREHPLTHAEQQQQSLSAEIDELRVLLEAYRNGDARLGESSVTSPTTSWNSEEFAVNRLTLLFGLSAYERRVLVLAAAVELDGHVASLVAGINGNQDPRPTFGLALAALPNPHWDALSPGSPLRWWRLLELGPGASLATRPIVLDERVLHYLTGVASPDERLDGLLSERRGPVALAPSQLSLAQDMARAVVAAEATTVVSLEGEDPEARFEVAQHVAGELGKRPLLVRAAALPPPGHDLAVAARHLDREALLADGLLVVDVEGAATTILDALLDLLVSPVVATVGDVWAGSRSDRTPLRASVQLPSPAEQRDLWHSALPGSLPEGLSATVEEVSQHYRFGAAMVDAVARQLVTGDGEDAPERLRRICRERARVRLEGLAQRIEPVVTWDDLVLPAGHIELLHDVVRQVRHRSQVYERWGFADHTTRGLGVTALFSGESGTGKTLAAEVVAAELSLDLYRIDLSATVSKYIGETEKNLARLFEGAEVSGAVLLFDEADALFGKRGEVRDGHDRYANLEVAYLLQRMESYRGLAILTTNMRSNLDRAFLRRLRFVVQFPFPDEAQRAGIWRRVFPPATPLEGIDIDRLARLVVSGGSIRSIAVSAAFAAAEDRSPVRPAHLLRAVRSEYAKAERSLTPVETAVLS